MMIGLVSAGPSPMGMPTTQGAPAPGFMAALQEAMQFRAPGGMADMPVGTASSPPPPASATDPAMPGASLTPAPADDTGTGTETGTTMAATAPLATPGKPRPPLPPHVRPAALVVDAVPGEIPPAETPADSPPASPPAPDAMAATVDEAPRPPAKDAGTAPQAKAPDPARNDPVPAMPPPPASPRETGTPASRRHAVAGTPDSAKHGGDGGDPAKDDAAAPPKPTQQTGLASTATLSAALPAASLQQATAVAPAAAPPPDARDVSRGAGVHKVSPAVAATGEPAAGDESVRPVAKDIAGGATPTDFATAIGRHAGSAIGQPSAPDAGTTRTAANTPSVSARHGEIGRQLGIEIARRTDAGGESLSVHLNPAELGRIHVAIAFDDGGSLRAVVSADSPAALDLLRRDTADLTRALGDAGIRADAQSFRFESRADGGGQQSRQQPLPTPSATTLGPIPPEEPIGPTYRPVRMPGRVDLLA